MPLGSPQGVGIGLRREHFAAVPKTERQVDWLEIIPENYVESGGEIQRVLDECLERWPVLCHGVSISVGGPDPFQPEYIKGLARLLRRVKAPFYTDHLCYASAGGVNFHDLLPLPFTSEAVTHCATRIRELSDRLELKVAVENISYYADMPGCDMSEPEFVSAVVREADCGLLLDVNNIFVNARNHGLDPSQALRGLPLDHVVQMHLAGHVEEAGRLIDNHGSPLVDGVWALYREALQLVGPVPTLLEWDTNIPELERVLDEADRAREIFHEVTQ